MNLKDTNNYPQVYSDIVNSILNDAKYPQSIIDILSDKREFGLKKYGDKSFQNSYKNTIESDTLTHAQEELIDSMNYYCNEIIKIQNHYVDKRFLDEFKSALLILKALYERLDAVKAHYASIDNSKNV